MAKKLNVKTVNKEQFAKALIFTGKFILKNRLNYADVKSIRTIVENFITNLKSTRKDLHIINNTFTNYGRSDYDLADDAFRYNYKIVGRSYIVGGNRLLNDNNANNKLVLDFFSDVSIISSKSYNYLQNNIKKGKSVQDLVDNLEDDAYENEETMGYYSVCDALDYNLEYAKRYGKSKDDTRKLFLYGLIMNK